MDINTHNKNNTSQLVQKSKSNTSKSLKLVTRVVDDRRYSTSVVVAPGGWCCHCHCACAV